MRLPLTKVLLVAAMTLAQAGFADQTSQGHTGVGPHARVELAQAPDKSGPASLADLLARADALSRSGKPNEAYELLLSHEDTYIGTIEFDYALGRAALDSGRPDKATLALSRVLALDPAHAGASIDLGRAYLALGDIPRARSTFRNLLSLDPPPQIRAQLQAFLDLADTSTSPPPAARSRSQGHLGAMLGWSSNVNQAPSQSVIFVPGIGSNFELPGQNVKKPDSFAGVLGGIDLTRALDATYSVFFGGDFLGRRNFHESDFNVAGYDAYFGLGAASGPHAGRIQALAARDYLGGSANRNLEGLTLSYVGTLSAATQLLGTVQGGRQRYVPEDFKIFDADYIVFGAGGSQKVGERSTVFVVFSAGYQNDVGGNPSGNRDLAGIQLGGEMVLGARTRLTAAAVGERSLYDKFDTGFETERHDVRRAFEAGLHFYLERDLSLRFNLSYAYTRSNIPIYEYTRLEGTLTLRRDFR
ncbi:MAG TPA: tetratricopeptide repeat protein [Burkholderiales bacterium]|nr:tetratricopeptide repeat protein [Burkholderiales bacterium]